MSNIFGNFGSITYDESLGTHSTPNRTGTPYPEYGTPKNDQTFNPGDDWGALALPVTWTYATQLRNDQTFNPGDDWGALALPVTWTYATQLRLDEPFYPRSFRRHMAFGGYKLGGEDNIGGKKQCH